MSIRVLRPSPVTAANGENRTRNADTLECCEELSFAETYELSSLCMESGGVGFVGVQSPPDPPTPTIPPFHKRLLLFPNPLLAHTLLVPPAT